MVFAMRNPMEANGRNSLSDNWGRLGSCFTHDDEEENVPRKGNAATVVVYSSLQDWHGAVSYPAIVHDVLHWNVDDHANALRTQVELWERVDTYDEKLGALCRRIASARHDAIHLENDVMTRCFVGFYPMQLGLEDGTLLDDEVALEQRLPCGCDMSGCICYAR